MAGQLVFALVFGGVGAMLLFVGIAAFIQTRRFATDAIRTSGTVVENKATQKRREDGVGQDTLYYPIFEFADFQGIQRRVQGSTASSPPSFSIGAKVRVLYSRSDPERARIDSFGNLWLLPLLASGLGVVLVLNAVHVWVQNKSVPLSVMGIAIPGSTQGNKADSRPQTRGRTEPPSATSKPSLGPSPIVITSAEPNPARIGDTITLRGANFGLQADHRVSVGGHGISVDLQVIEWNKDAVTVKIPDDPRIQKGVSYYYRISRIGHAKGVPHYIESSNLFMFELESENESQPIEPPGANLPSSTAAAEWIAVGSIAGSAIYADSANIHVSGDIVTIWGLVDHKTAIQSLGKPYMSFKAKLKFDCKEKQLQFLYRSFHSDNMAKGEIVSSNPFNEKDWRPIPFASRNFAGTLGQFACAKQ